MEADSKRSERLPQPSGIKRNKKACTECRQQKVRCDATENSTEPCTRCRRMKLHCVISDPFKREHKRQRLSDLEHETLELRRRLDSQNSWPPQLATPTASTEPSIRLTPIANHHSSPAERVPAVSPMPGPEEQNEERQTVDPKEPTIAQSIEGSTLQAIIIDELFQRYFQDFHQFLPILDRDVPPNEYYRRSKFLFWAVVVTACRNFPRDPTLLDSIGEKVLALALMSLRHSTIPTIKGFLLLLTWPMPKRAVGGAEITFPISGSLIHLAMQIGLHIPTSSQDFSKVKVNLTETEIARRAELWGYCIVTYQRACAFKGQSPLSLLDLYQDSEQRYALFSRITPSLRFQLKLNSLLTRCCSALLQNGLRLMSKDLEHGLDVLIRVFEATIKDIEPEANTGELDRFYLYTARLNVQIFHFYKKPTSAPNYLLTRLYSSACLILRHLDRMDQVNLKLSAAPFYFVAVVNMASVTLLRLLKSSVVQHLDVDVAKETFFLGVNIMKRISVESDDMPARMVMVLTQLWNSDQAFKRPDGSEHMDLRIRTRLAMSPVFDCVWWWREQFQGQSGAYPLQSSTEMNSGATPMQSETPPVHLQAYNNPTPVPPYQDMTTFLDDQLLAELGWTNSSNYLYSSLSGPMATEWYSPSNVSGFAL